MARAGYTDWIWILFFRRCWIGPDKVEVTRPIIFGRGFLFNRTRQVVTVRRCLFGRTLSKEEIPFSGVSIIVTSKYQPPTSISIDGGTFGGGTTYGIKMVIGQRRITILGESNTKGRIERVLAAIRTVIKRARNYE